MSDNAMELLRRRVQDAIDAPYKLIKVGRGEDAREEAVPAIADRDLATFLELAAKHGGRVTAVEMARLLLDARKTLQSPEEWDRFAALVDPDYEPPEELAAIEEELKP